MSSPQAVSWSLFPFSSVVRSIPLPLMVAVALIILVTAIVFILLKIQRGSLKTVKLQNVPLLMANPQTGEPYYTPSAKLPASSNGVQYTYSFWLYIEDLHITDDEKIILFRGNTSAYENGTFFVYMDAKTNKLYASSATNAVKSSGFIPLRLTDLKNNRTYLTSTIDFVPLQRWVNITYAIKDNIMTTFVDGDLYGVTSVFEIRNAQTGARALIIPHKGDIMLGGNKTNESVNAYIGNAIYCNYAVNVNQAREIYNKGPYEASWLGYFGLGNIGFRSPIYKVNTAS